MVENEWRVIGHVTRRCLPEPNNIEPLRLHDPRLRPVIGIPMERVITQEAFFSFCTIFRGGWEQAQQSYCRNDIARYNFVKFMLDRNYSHLIMLDSDHVHPGDIVQRLARWFLAYPDEVQVVGGLNFRRGEPYDPCAFVDNGDGGFHRMAEWGQGAIEVEALGTGSIMIAREVFEAIPEAEGWWDYRYPDHSGWPGTDMTFSLRCKEHGISLWCDTTTTSPHLTTMAVDEGTYRGFLEARMTEEQPRTVVIPERIAL